MSILEKPLRVSVNLRLKNKDERGDTLARGVDWQNVELTPGDLAHFIGKGVAYSVQVRDGIRRKSNFIASDIASVDIDRGLRIEDALGHPLCRDHLTILYRTKSHTEENHRYRLVFALPRTITKAEEQRALNRGLAMRLGGDLSAVDAVRISYGSDLQAPDVFDRALSSEALEGLIREGRAGPQRDSAADPNRLASGRGRASVPQDQLLHTREGGTVRLKDVEGQAPIHCPFHQDERASAFARVTETGSRFVHCMVCQTTWWGEGDTPSTYNFDSWSQVVEAINAPPDPKTTNVNVLFPDEPLKKPWAGRFPIPPKLMVTRSADKHFRLDAVPKGLTFVKSPKGSGKTTTLAALADYRTLRFNLLQSDDQTSPLESYTDDSFPILLIGHRRSLIRDMCSRLGLNCYLDDGDAGGDELQKRKRRYGVCLDSLWKARHQHYKLIIIDESEQVLAHFLAETLEHRDGIFTIFKELLTNTPHIMALDADLGWTTYGTLCRLGQLPPNDRAPKPVNIFYNKPPPDRKELLLFSSKEHLFADFLNEVKAGKKIFLTSNSKAKIDRIAALLEKELPQVKFRKVTSDNSNNEEIQEFIVNIKERIADYQVVLTSPSLGTGVDITLEPDAAPIDIVYGFFENLINTHFDIDQQLRRVRNPGAVRVWISPRTLTFETETAAVRSDLQNEKNGLVTHSWGGDLLDLAAEVIAMQRASKNRLKKNFVAYKEAQGTVVLDVVPDDEMVNRGKEALKAGDEHWIASRSNELIHAAPITQGDYLDIKQRKEDDEEISDAEMASYCRARIESFFVQPVNPELVMLDLQRFRMKTWLFESLMKEDKTGVPWQDDEVFAERRRKQLRLLPNRAAVPWLVHTLFEATPIYRGRRFQPDVTYSCQDLGDFVRVVRQHAGEIQNLLNKPIPKDLDNKPTSFLRFLLDLVGLTQISAGKKRHADGQATYYYAVDPESLERMVEIAARRAEYPQPWAFVHELHRLDGALYERQFHATSDDGVKGIYCMVPVTEGARVKLKDTEKAKKKLGYDPTIETTLKASSRRTAERLGRSSKLPERQAREDERRRKLREGFKSFT